jgi:hypothetical protein
MQGKREKPTNSKPENQTKPERQNPNEPKLPEPDLDKITIIKINRRPIKVSLNFLLKALIKKN